ncbi:ribonuclease H1 isoform X2 [Megalops cyprinoides]|nr:ribonuclease H1 isoform X2 [Megalops cyprinoides]XP_036405728.1 ribonuclease H1 isoform X2 [Megalops cyprinoides]
MVKGKYFYAVKKGHRPGVYSTWEECKSQVDKFPSASFKKFASEEDAWAFVRGQAAGISPASDAGNGSCEVELPRLAPEPISLIPLGIKRPCGDTDAGEEPKRFKRAAETSAAGSDGFTHMGDAVVVYTDGCCSRNGNTGARAGIGVYWGPEHPMNVSERLQGRQTNQRAELQAACKALEQAKEANIKKLVLYTDSKFTINGITSWVKTWKVNGWKLKAGGRVINREDFEQLDKLNQELEVKWMHIPGHAGYRGNEEADRLSREGASKPLN